MNFLRNRLVLSTVDSTVAIMNDEQSSCIQRWTGRASMRMRQDLSDLLCEYVDEHVERFMTLPSRGCPLPKEEEEERKPSPLSMSRKRSGLAVQNLLDARESTRPACRQRTLDPDEMRRFESLYTRYDHDGIPTLCDESDFDAAIAEQAVMLELWNQKLHEVSMLGYQPETICHSGESTNLFHRPDRLSHQHPLSRTRQEAGEHEEELDRMLLRDLRARYERGADTYNKEKDSFIKLKPFHKSCGQKSNGNSIELYPGKSINVLDKKHAYTAIANGGAALFRCVGCKMLLIAGNDTKILFCSACGTLAPTSMNG